MRRGYIEIDSEHCKGCGLCVHVCPPKIISLDMTTVNPIGYNPALVVEMDKCIACKQCAVICPDVIIDVFLVKEQNETTN